MSYWLYSCCPLGGGRWERGARRLFSAQLSPVRAWRELKSDLRHPGTVSSGAPPPSLHLAVNLRWCQSVCQSRQCPLRGNPLPPQKKWHCAALGMSGLATERRQWEKQCSSGWGSVLFSSVLMWSMQSGQPRCEWTDKSSPACSTMPPLQPASS